MTVSTDGYLYHALEEHVAACFPSVKKFRIASATSNVEPVVFTDEHGKRRHEYPPVAMWEVGDIRYRYVFKPTFRATPWQVSPFFCGTTVSADYSEEKDRLFEILRLSAEGKTAKEINGIVGAG